MKILMVLAPNDFRDDEYSVPRTVFEQENATVMTTSSSKLAIGRFGLEVKIDIPLNKAKAEDFDAIFWVGGGGCLDYLTNQDARNLAGDFVKRGKVIGAICAAPRLLLDWRLLKGKKITGWNGDSNLEKLALKGEATYTGIGVEIDGEVLTADGPDSAKKAGEVFIELLKKQN